MNGILADSNAIGHVRILLQILETDAWRELWAYVDVSVRTFDELGLSHDSSDKEIWLTCQREQLVLMTNNRNADSADSLEEMIRTQNTPQSLPIFTFADYQRISDSREYAEQVVDRMLIYLLDLENLRGTGRLYLP